MTHHNSATLDEVLFRVTSEHPCSYLEDKVAKTLFVDPDFDITMSQYSDLATLGFRRSGDHVYRPHCSSCGLCIPVRIPVNDFKANRSQRRNLKHNHDLAYTFHDAEFKDEHYALYRRYMSHRHAGGGMDNDEPDNYKKLLQADWSASKLIEFKFDQQLVMIAVLDCLADGLSAVYTFFEPTLSKRGLGIFGVLSEIELVKTMQQQWLYLGYWNPESIKMAYKTQYQPIEFFDGQYWQIMTKKHFNNAQ